MRLYPTCLLGTSLGHLTLFASASTASAASATASATTPKSIRCHSSLYFLQYSCNRPIIRRIIQLTIAHLYIS